MEHRNPQVEENRWSLTGTCGKRKKRITDSNAVYAVIKAFALSKEKGLR